MTEGGRAFFSTLIKSGRISDHYLDMLGKAGAVVPRTAGQLSGIFDEAAMPIEYVMSGET
jgi:hypothetical protein